MNLPENLGELIKNQKTRRELTYGSHFLFFHTYFGHYVDCKTAPFQKEMFALTEDMEVKNIVVVAFRGSGKSTIMNMSFPLWSILGAPQCKYVVIVGLTQDQAKRHLKNIKQELESNQLLKSDLGPFKEIENDWSSYTLEIPSLGARITAVSTDQSIRGTRHGSHRPDLIICDDVEDLASVKTREGRDKVDDFITSEVIPAGSSKTRLVVIGNLLHEDSFIMRLRKRIIDDEFDGQFRAYPLVDEAGNCLWPGKYPTKEAIDAERRRVGKEKSWQREYMLTIVSDDDKVVQREWIRYYSELPDKSVKGNDYRYTAIAIDPAISQRDGADYTAIVIAEVYGTGDEKRIFILPNITNSRMTFKQTVELGKLLSDTYKYKGARPKMYVEEVAYQKSLIEQLKDEGCQVKGFQTNGIDKRARLAAGSFMIEKGKVFFPKKGAEQLIRQVVNFGLERHDDLADALSMLLIMINKTKHSTFRITMIGEPRRGPLAYHSFGNIWDMRF